MRVEIWMRDCEMEVDESTLINTVLYSTMERERYCR